MHERVYIDPRHRYEVDIHLDETKIELFIADAQLPPVPKEFPIVHDWIRQTRRDERVQRRTIASGNYDQETIILADKLLMLPFTSPFAARYALTYADCIGWAKQVAEKRNTFDALSAETEPSRQAYTEFLRRTADRFHLKPEELMWTLSSQMGLVPESDEQELLRLKAHMAANLEAREEAAWDRDKHMVLFKVDYKHLLKMRQVAAAKFTSFTDTANFFFYTVEHPILTSNGLKSLELLVQNQFRKYGSGRIKMLAHRAMKENF